MDIKTKIKALRRYNRVLAVAVGGLAAIFLLVVFIFSEEDSGIATAASEVAQLSDNIRRFYQKRPDYWGLSTQAVIDKKMYPLQMLKAGNLTGFMGNQVLVGNGADGNMLMPGARSFDIIYKGLSNKQCIELASYKFEQKFWLGISGISVISGNGEQLFSWDDKTHSLPIQKSQAKDICGANSTIIWHF